jgi:hypothetical protein
MRLMYRIPYVLQYLSYLIVTKFSKIVFPKKLLVLAVLRQAALSHIANTVRDTVLKVRTVRMRTIEDYNPRW